MVGIPYCPIPSKNHRVNIAVGYRSGAPSKLSSNPNPLKFGSATIGLRTVIRFQPGTGTLGIRRLGMGSASHWKYMARPGDPNETGFPMLSLKMAPWV